MKLGFPVSPFQHFSSLESTAPCSPTYTNIWLTSVSSLRAVASLLKSKPSLMIPKPHHTCPHHHGSPAQYTEPLGTDGSHCEVNPKEEQASTHFLQHTLNQKGGSFLKLRPFAQHFSNYFILTINCFACMEESSCQIVQLPACFSFSLKTTS